MKTFIDFIIWILKQPIHREKIKSEVSHQKTPYEELKEAYLLTYGKFPLNRVWQLVQKFKNKTSRTTEENLFCQVCLLYAHSHSKETGFIKDDGKFYEIPKVKEKIPKPKRINKKNFIVKEQK